MSSLVTGSGNFRDAGLSAAAAQSLVDSAQAGPNTDFQHIKTATQALGFKLSPESFATIRDIAVKALKNADKDLLSDSIESVPKEEFDTYKLHLAAHNDDRCVNVYLSKFKEIQRQAQDMKEVKRLSGTTKIYTPACQISFDFSKPHEEVRVTDVGHLRINFENSSGFDGDILLALWEKEMEAMSALQGHPNICKLLDSGFYPGKHMGQEQEKAVLFVDQYNLDLLDFAALCEGVFTGQTDDSYADCDEKIQRLGIALKEIREKGKYREFMELFFSDLLSALEYIHHKGYLHLDIKSENVLVRLKARIEAALTDFGWAVLVKDKATTSVRGTDVTLSPECYFKIDLASKSKYRDFAIDKYTDCWAMGCVLYEFVAGLTPRWSNLERLGTSLVFVLEDLENGKAELARKLSQETTEAQEDTAETDPNLSLFKENLSFLDVKTRDLKHYIDQLNPQTMADLFDGNKVLSTRLEKEIGRGFDEILEGLKEERRLLAGYAKQAEPQQQKFYNDLESYIYTTLYTSLSELAETTGAKLEQIWIEAEKTPQPQDSKEKIIWSLLRPIPAERATASEALKMLSSVTSASAVAAAATTAVAYPEQEVRRLNLSQSATSIPRLKRVPSKPIATSSAAAAGGAQGSAESPSPPNLQTLQRQISSSRRDIKVTRVLSAPIASRHSQTASSSPRPLNWSVASNQIPPSSRPLTSSRSLAAANTFGRSLDK